MGKKAIRLYLPEEVDGLSPLQATGMLAAEEALARVLAHARDTLTLSEDERRGLGAEWANSSIVVFVLVAH